jgi:thiamine-monophosphate kinase
MGEFELIDRYFRRAAAARGGDAVVLGIGDDCALLQAPSDGQALAISSDMLIEGRHFFAGSDPAGVGHKSLAVNLSDLAAMGAQPLGFTLAIALPGISEQWLAGFSEGLFALSDRFACPLVGGDTTRGPLAISITVFGQVPPGQALRRDRARPADQLWVSGPLGGASFAVAARKRGDAAIDAGAARRLDWPQPQVALGLQLRGIAHAAIDLSDGLAGDLRHVLAASSDGTGSSSGLMAELFTADIPLDPCLAGLGQREALGHALHGGDDYELLFTAAPKDQERIRTLFPTARMIGRLRAGRGILLTSPDGKSESVDRTGFDHFTHERQN